VEAEIIEGSKEEEEGRARFATERWVSGPFSLYFFSRIPFQAIRPASGAYAHLPFVYNVRTHPKVFPPVFSSLVPRRIIAIVLVLRHFFPDKMRACIVLECFFLPI